MLDSILSSQNSALFLKGLVVASNPITLDTNPSPTVVEEQSFEAYDFFLITFEDILFQHVIGNNSFAATDSNALSIDDPFLDIGIASGSTEFVYLKAADGNMAAEVEVEFNSDPDWNLTAIENDTLENKISIHNLYGAPSVIGSYSGYLPVDTDADSIVLCPSAQNVSQTNLGCNLREVLPVGDSRVSIENHGGTDYYKVSGQTSTGLLLSTQAEIDTFDTAHTGEPEDSEDTENTQDSEAPNSNQQLIRTGGYNH